MFDQITERIENFIENKASEIDIYAKYFVNYLNYSYADYYAKQKIDGHTRRLLTELPFYEISNKFDEQIEIPE